MYKNNSFEIVGTLTQILESKEGRFSNGNEYISVKALISSTIDNKEHEFTVEFFTNKLTQDKVESKLYHDYANIGSLVNHRVSVSGQLRENRFFSTKGKKVTSNVTLAARFISKSNTNEDYAKFTLGGFIVRSLEEKKNKNGEIYAYSLELGEANYKEDNMFVFKVLIDPKDPHFKEIMDGVKTYKLGDTVELYGNISSELQINTVEAKNVAFGQAPTRVYRNRLFGLYLESGTQPLPAVDPITQEANPDKYSKEEISNLANAYKAQSVELERQGNEKLGASLEVAEKPLGSNITENQTSLI